MNEDKINKLKVYLNNSGFKKEASLLAVLLGMVAACKSPQSYEFSEEVGIFDMIDQATLQDVNSSVEKLNKDPDDPNVPPVRFGKALDFIKKYAEEGKLYKNMELSWCYTAEKIIPTRYDFDVKNIQTGEINKVFLGDFKLQFSCMPITAKGIYYTENGEKIYLSKERASEVNRGQTVTHNENNPLTMYVPQQDSVTYSGPMEKDEDGDYTNMVVSKNTFVVIADISRVEIGEDEYFVFHKMSGFFSMHEGICDQDWFNHRSSSGIQTQ